MGEEFPYIRHSSNLSEYMPVVGEKISLNNMWSIDTPHLRDLEDISVHHRLAPLTPKMEACDNKELPPPNSGCYATPVPIG